MNEMKKINEMELENVAGGDRRIVNTGMKLDAVVRSGAGFKFPQIFSVKNGNAVITTGKCIHADGRTWYEISAPVKGFMAGGMLGLQDDKYNR